MSKVSRVMTLFLIASSLTSVAEAGQQGGSAQDRPWGFNLSVDVPYWVGEDSIAGQGIIKQNSGPEKRTVETPDQFPGFRLDGEVHGEDWTLALAVARGTTTESTTVAPGPNGQLFLGLDDRGFNGQLFTGFAAQEEITKEFDENRVSVGRRVGVVVPYGWVGWGSQDYTSTWFLTDFPTTGSETQHRLQWTEAGFGMRTLFPPLMGWGQSGGLYVNFDAWIGAGQHEYEAHQEVLNAPLDLRTFDILDEGSVVPRGGTVQVEFRIPVGGAATVDLKPSVTVRTRPGLVQPDGDGLGMGQQNELELVSPREYRLTVGFRF